jgi:ribosome-binding factor A
MAPNLSIEADTSFDYATHIDSLLRQDEVARDLAEDDESGDAADDRGPDRRER